MDSIPLVSCLQPLAEIAMSVVHTHTHTATPIWFIFEHWSQVAYKYIRLCLQCYGIKGVRGVSEMHTEMMFCNIYNFCFACEENDFR